MELPPRAAMGGVPHTPGTREYLTCERGQIELSAGGESFTLDPGDVVVFRGDQRHGYRNPGATRRRSRTASSPSPPSAADGPAAGPGTLK